MFQNVTERFAAFAVSREYRRYARGWGGGEEGGGGDGGKETEVGARGGGGAGAAASKPPSSLLSSLCSSTVSFYARYTALLLGTLAAYSLGMLVNFKSILQFTMSVVRTSSFVASNGMHAHSPSCDGIPGALYIDSYYAGLTSFIAWVMLLPAVYEVAKVITPGNPLIRQRYRGSMAVRAAAAAAASADDEVPVAVAISDPATENPLSRSHSLSDKLSFSASSKVLYSFLRHPMTTRNSFSDCARTHTHIPPRSILYVLSPLPLFPIPA